MVLMWVREGEEAKMRLGFLVWVAGRAALKKGGLGKGNAGVGGGKPMGDMCPAWCLWDT